MANPLERPLRRLEHLMGAQRDDRSLWAWVGPIGTAVITFTFLILFGVFTNIDLGLTIPMAIVMSLLLGTLSAFYLTASSADAADDDGEPPRRTTGPSPGGGGVTTAPPSPRDQQPGAEPPPGDDHATQPARRDPDAVEPDQVLVPLAPSGPRRQR